jgi:hypothetical protein
MVFTRRAVEADAALIEAATADDILRPLGFLDKPKKQGHNVSIIIQ